MFIRKFAAIAALLMLVSFNTNAGIEKDDKTISIFGSFTSGEFSDTLILQVAGGYFMTDTLELQGVVLLVASEDDFGNTSSVGGYGANANLYLPGGNPDFIPYIGGGGTLILTDFNGATDTAIGLNGQAGIKQFLTEEISINYQAQFVTSSDYDAFILSVGFSIFLE
jgi:hypothetical protein